jgi:hypothetical protein
MRGFLFLLVGSSVRGSGRHAREFSYGRGRGSDRERGDAGSLQELHESQQAVSAWPWKAARGGQDVGHAGKKLLSEHAALSPRDVVQPGAGSR